MRTNSWHLFYVAYQLLSPVGPRSLISGHFLAHILCFVIPSTIGVNVSEADGSSNFSSVRAGDTVCIPAGNRGPLTLTNFQGSASEPITFINNGGQVTIMGPPNQQKGDSTAALTIEKSSHIRLTGTGQEQKCGAPYPSSLQQCGIRITGGWWGLMGRENSNMEIDHVEFYQTGGPM